MEREKRERRIWTLSTTPISLLLSSYMPATMDVDSDDDDDEIIAERGTKSIYSYFFTTRACVLLFLSFHHIRRRRRRKRERRRSLRAKTTDNTTGQNKIERSSELERTLRIIRDGFVRKAAASRLSSSRLLFDLSSVNGRKREREREEEEEERMSVFFRCWLSIDDVKRQTKKKKKGKICWFFHLSL